MKKLLFTLVIVLIAATAFAQTDRGQAKQVVAVIFHDPYGNFTPQQGSAAKSAVNDILIGNTLYTTINQDFINNIVENNFSQHEDFIYSPTSRVELGELLGANKLVFIETLENNQTTYSLTSTLVDAITGKQEENGSITFERIYADLMYLYAQKTSGFLAQDPTAFKREIDKKIRREEKRREEKRREEKRREEKRRGMMILNSSASRTRTIHLDSN